MKAAAARRNERGVLWLKPGATRRGLVVVASFTTARGKPGHSCRELLYEIRNPAWPEYRLLINANAVLWRPTAI